MFSPLLLLIVVLLCSQNNRNNSNIYNVSSTDNNTEESIGKLNACRSNKKNNKVSDSVLFKNIDLEERQEMIQEILPYLNIGDRNTITKLQDMLDIIYKMNRVRGNSYDGNDYRQLANVSFLENTQEIIRKIAPHLNKTDRINSDNVINLIKGIEMAKYNIQKLNRSGNQNPQNIIESLKPMIEGESVNFRKIKDMLRKLNEEN